MLYCVHDQLYGKSTFCFKIEALREALAVVQAEKRRLLRNKMDDQLSRLTPIKLPKKPVGLAARTGKLLNTASADM